MGRPIAASKTLRYGSIRTPPWTKTERRGHDRPSSRLGSSASDRIRSKRTSIQDGIPEISRRSWWRASRAVAARRRSQSGMAAISGPGA